MSVLEEVVRGLRAPCRREHFRYATCRRLRYARRHFDDAPADISWAIDMTLGVMARSDVSAADKEALGRALGFVLQ